MATACILVFAAIAALTPSLPPAAPAERAASAARRDDLPRWAAGYRAAQIDLRWQAADADANTIVLIAPRRDALQARIERASLIARALSAGERVGMADLAGAGVTDPRCRNEPRLTARPDPSRRFSGPCPR